MVPSFLLNLRQSVHTLTCCTHIFLRTARSLRTSHTSHACARTRMAQVHEKGVCLHACLCSLSRLLPSHVSPVFAVPAHSLRQHDRPRVFDAFFALIPKAADDSTLLRQRLLCVLPVVYRIEGPAGFGFNRTGSIPGFPLRSVQRTPHRSHACAHFSHCALYT